MRRRRLARLGSVDPPASNNEPVQIRPPDSPPMDQGVKLYGRQPQGSSNLTLPPLLAPAVAPCRPPVSRSPSLEPTQIQLLTDKEAAMEVEDSSCEKQFNSGVDVDSGIENMEVEDSDRKEVAPRSRVSSFIRFPK